VPAGEGWAEERPPRDEFELRAPESVPSLEDLIRLGLAFSAHGDLAGASRTWQRIRDSYPDHPAGPIFEIHTLEVRKSLDYQDAQYDEALRARAKEALDLAEAWLKRAPHDPWAHFYAGQAKYELMLLAGMAARYYTAGKTGEQAREHLERALELDPTLVDARFPLGSYYYWASIATRFIGWLSWLWFVPTGEHDLAMAYMEQVSREGSYYRFDASLQLAQLYLYFEDQPERAAPILARLHAAYPENTAVTFEILELRLIQGNYEGTIEKALELEQSQGSQFGDEVRRTMAKIWRARAELLRGQPDRVVAALAEVEAGSAKLSPWCVRWLLLTRGNLEDVLGNREQAIAHYERVLDLKSRFDSGRSVTLAQEGLEKPFRL
jgi:tetratricopeptide (TPR) repeat protein